MTSYFYLESSALLRGLLEGDATFLGALGRGAKLVTSALTAVEVERALLRASADKRLTAEERRVKRQAFRELAQTCEVIALGTPVLERAGLAFPVEPVRSLDALHLASAVLFEQAMGVALTLITVDERVRRNAVELGFAVLPMTN